MHIREATRQESENIREVYCCAFPEEEREIVAKLALDLLAEETTPKTISLVAEEEGSVIGHVAFSPVMAINNEDFQGYILAPLAVKPDHQKCGIGSMLVESGIRQIKEMYADALFVYGDPAYYSRFGFNQDAAERYTPPYELQYPFGWQAMVLNECSTENSAVTISCVPPLCRPELW